METRPSDYDFGPMHEAVQKYLDDDFLAMASSVILEGGEPVDFRLWGHQDREAGIRLAADSIFRIYSNTKIITSVAAMTLWEAGRFDLDDPVEKHLPQLAGLSVLREGATDAADAEPLDTPPTIRQLMSHSAGFSYGFLLESPVDAVYTERNLSRPDSTLEDLVEALADIPLANRPGTRFQYSVATDVLARLVEVLSGERFDRVLARRIFEPLGMVDTDFHVPASKHDRFCVNYAARDQMDPMVPGLDAAPDVLLGSYLAPKPFLSGGGGLVSTILDYTRFIRMIVGGGELEGTRILDAGTLELMRTNQLPEGAGVQFPFWHMPDTVFGLGFALKTAPAEGEPDAAIGEYHWGGMAGTHSWMSPAADIAALVFTQRLPGFWHPFSHEYKRQVYAAVT